MTITVVVKNTNGEGYDRKAAVYTVDTPSEGEPVTTLVAELAGGEEVTTGVHSSRSIEIKETAP